MKKYFLISLILIGIKSKAIDLVPLTFGPLISMTSTSLSSNPDVIDQIAGAGYNGGALVRLKVLFFYAQAEVSFGSKSASVTVNDTGVNSNVSYKLKGMDFTALAGMKLFGLGELGNFRVFGGYNWNNFSDITYSEDGNVFAASNVNNNNHSFVFGLGVDLSKLSLDLKFINGFIDLSKSASSIVESRVVNLTLAYRFK